MVDGGGGVLYQRRGRPWRLGRDGGTRREAVGLCLATRPKEDEGGRGPAVWERRGGTRPVGQGVGWWAGWLGLEKKKRKSIRN
jgi:hypothetical protein